MYFSVERTPDHYGTAGWALLYQQNRKSRYGPGRERRRPGGTYGRPVRPEIVGPGAGRHSAVWLHGRAGDLAAAEKGEYGMAVSDMIEMIPCAIKECEEE